MPIEQPTKEQLISLVKGIREVQGNIIGARSMPKHTRNETASNIEALKAPIYYLWEFLGYGGDLSLSRLSKIWTASFKSSPREYIEECISQLKTYQMPIDEYDLERTGLRQRLISFYSDMLEAFGE